MKRTLLCLMALSFFVACQKQETPSPENPQPETPAPGNPYAEPEPEYVTFTGARLEYKGDDGYTGISDEWVLLLYTENYPAGPSQVMRLDFNARYKPEQVADMNYIVGSYEEQYSTGDFSAGTFNWGQMFRMELPGGSVEVPDMSYYGDIPDGETDFEPDLLREGVFLISAAEPDGNYTVEGILVGTKYRKRYFSYTGPLEAQSYVDPAMPNSTLKSDLSLSGLFSKIRVYDRGNVFFLPPLSDGEDPSLPNATSYRYFECYLADDGIDFGPLVPGGNGNLLQLDLLVPYASQAADGIPAGEYTVSHRYGTGIDRGDILPFRFLEGAPDQFARPAGSWYRSLKDGEWGDAYARITDGTVKVERTGGKHRITVDLLDCGTPQHRISGSLELPAGVTVFE